MHRNYFLRALVCAILFTGCMPSPYYQREEAIPQNAWSYDYKPDFKVDVTDTGFNYNFYFVIRHTEAYPYGNIWMWLSVKKPGDTTFQRSRVNIVLAERSGKWLGRGMGEIWEQVMPINYPDSTLFHKKGTYEFKLEQNMRVNPLPEIMNVGLRVEKGDTRIATPARHQ